MAEAKHAFVDDNPYLVYSPNAEITYDGNGGGETGGQFVVTLTYDDTAGDYISDKNAKEIYDAYKAGFNCIAISDDSSGGNEINAIYYLVSVFAAPSENDTNYQVLFSTSFAMENPNNQTICSITTVMILKAGDTEQCVTTTYGATQV